MHPFSMTLWI